jgi:hypothetical protein
LNGVPFAHRCMAARQAAQAVVKSGDREVKHA